MSDRPIRFYAPEVRATLAGMKTQTRRVVKPQPEWTEPATVWQHGDGHSGLGWYAHHDEYPEDGALHYRCPYGPPGDRLWVRETWAQFGQGAIYRATSDYRPPGAGMWRPSIHMPRWASRITLEITGVRVERLQDISEADAIAEGCARNHNGYFWGGPHAVIGLKQMATPKQAYRDLWESINGPGSWDANPFVWVVEFKRAAALTQPEGGA